MSTPVAEPLLDYMAENSTRGQRSAAFLRIYAGKLRDRTAAAWEIPNTVASTLEDIANWIDDHEALALANDGGRWRLVSRVLQETSLPDVSKLTAIGSIMLSRNPLSESDVQRTKELADWFGWDGAPR